MRKKIISVLIVLVLVVCLSGQLFAAERTYRRSWKIYNAPSGNYPFAMVVGQMNLHIDADATIPKIYNTYTTSSTKIGGSFSGTTTWTVNYSDRVAAFCSSIYNWGIPKLGILGHSEGFTISRSFSK